MPSNDQLRKIGFLNEALLHDLPAQEVSRGSNAFNQNSGKNQRSGLNKWGSRLVDFLLLPLAILAVFELLS